MISVVPEQAIAYSVEASHWYVQALDKVILTAHVKKLDSEGSAWMRGAYGHTTASFGNGLNVAFEEIGDISFSNHKIRILISINKQFTGCFFTQKTVCISTIGFYTLICCLFFRYSYFIPY